MTTAGNSLGRIQIRDLSIRLGQGSEAFEAVRDLNLEARPGEFVCLLGSDWWGWRTSPGAGPANCPGVCSSAWRSPGCWSTGRACC